MPSNYKKKKQRRSRKTHSQFSSNDPEEDVESEAICYGAPTTEENNNKPYLVRNSDIWGRYLVTARDLKAGEKIIEVDPVAIGPWAESDPVCLGCHRPFLANSTIERCSECGWRICSPLCTGLEVSKWHKKLECIPLKKHNVAKHFESCSSAVQRKQMYEAIFALRCLLLRTADPEKHALLLEMDSLNDVRRQNSVLWMRNQKAIVERIRNDWKFTEFSEDEIHTVCGIIEVNSFQIGQHDIRARALYPEAFYIMHDCTPNTTHTDDPVTHVLSIRVTNDLKAGEAFTLSYSYTLQGTLKRRQHLNDCKFFWCNCKRCADPTEFGTHCSTLKCPDCHKGNVLSTDPLNQDADWKCQSCKFKVPSIDVSNLLDKLFKEIDTIDGNSIELYENFMNKYCTVLHENHYLFLSAKHSLCQLYGKISGYLITEMTMKQVERKASLCRSLLSLVDQYEPGLSRLRGVLMYELHAPIMVEAKHLFDTKQINASQLKWRVHEASQLLKLCAEILSFEPVGSPEFQMATAAREALREMRC